MNSSTKPPVTNPSVEKKPVQSARKFQFGTDFDIEEERKREREELVSQHDEIELDEEFPIEPPEPTFSASELEAARQQGYEQGLSNGREEALSGVGNTANMILDHMAIRLEGLFLEQEKQFKDAQEIAVRTAIAAIKKSWPQIVQNHGLDILDQTIRQALEYNPEETRIVVRVHDTMLDPIVQRLEKIQQQQAFSGKIIVLSDDNVAKGDCKIEWADGGMERLSRVLSQQLDRAADRILAGLFTTSQNVDTERTSS